MFRKYIRAIKSGDNVKLLVKIFPLDPTALVALFIISTFFIYFRFYVYGGYQILNGSLKDFYSISLDDNESKFNWV